ncbi:MAG TPA: serine hydrolase domain-containing protein, partial [Myxococcota bacterium]|nr:serine hydrolase domain-containing protein [Myxococcota bacterium]
MIDARTDAALRGALDGLAAASGAPGAVAAIRCEGLGAWVAASGFADLERRSGLAADARLPIYSVAKSMIAVCVLRLAELRALALDDPLARWLPDLPFRETVTLRQLLAHSAGVPNYSELPEQIEALAASPSSAWTFAQLVERSCARGLAFAPGAGWLYSNTGYALLARVVERANATSLAEAVQQHIAGPLGLSATGVVADRRAFASLAPAFSAAFRDGESLADVRAVYDPGWVAHGLVASSAAEVAEFFYALFAGKLVQRESLAEMTRLVRVSGNHPRMAAPAYGLGLMGDLAGAFGPD